MLMTVAAVSLRELGRRRVALGLVVALPLAFYLVRVDTQGQAIRFLGLGVGWAIATLSLFAHVNARQLDQRLGVIGASPTALFLGRQLALVATGLTVAGGYFALIAVTQDVARLWAVGLLLATTAILAAPLGAVVSLLVPRELEGALLLLTIMAMQMLADPAGTVAKVLPLWSAREIGTYAVDASGADFLRRGLLHFAVTLTVCGVGAWAASVVRLRPHNLPAPDPDHSPAMAESTTVRGDGSSSS